MDGGGFVFFTFLAAIIVVPQILRYQERGRLHETLRMAFERGQPVPPELIAALQWGRRRVYVNDFDPMAPPMTGWQPRGAPPPFAPPPAGTSAAPGTPPAFGTSPAADGAAPSPPPPQAATPFAAQYPSLFPSQSRRDLRRGLVWASIGIGLIAAGGAFYAGLYDVGGAPETFASFAAFGAIPLFVGLTYLGLAYFSREKTRV